MDKLDASPWLQLGLGGGALFLVAFIILAWFMFLKTFMKNNDKLCDKIEKLVEAFYDSNKQNENIKDGQDKTYSLVQKIYETVTEIKAGMFKEGD